MSERISELAGRLIVSLNRNGRCMYDAQAKQELIEACGRPGISMAKLARDCGINTNLLNTWVHKHERKTEVLAVPAAVEPKGAAPAFVPVHIEAPTAPAQASMQLQVQLSNGVVVDLAGCDLSQAHAFWEALGRLRCSVKSSGVLRASAPRPLVFGASRDHVTASARA
jgi:transposase